MAVGLCLAALPANGAVTAAGAAWRAAGPASNRYAEGASQDGRGRVRVVCGDEAVALHYGVPREWDGNRIDGTTLTLDGEDVPVVADGIDDAVVLSNRPGDAVGITPELLSRLKSGRTLVVGGPATTRIPAARRTFPLAGAEGAIAAVERGCPAAQRR